MLTDIQMKRRLGEILGLEEHGEDADWYAISTRSLELLQEIPATVPSIVKAYLVDSDLRRVSRGFAQGQLNELILYLRS